MGRMVRILNPDSAFVLIVSTPSRVDVVDGDARKRRCRWQSILPAVVETVGVAKASMDVVNVTKISVAKVGVDMRSVQVLGEASVG